MVCVTRRYRPIPKFVQADQTPIIQKRRNSMKTSMNSHYSVVKPKFSSVSRQTLPNQHNHQLRPRNHHPAWVPHLPIPRLVKSLARLQMIRTRYSQRLLTSSQHFRLQILIHFTIRWVSIQFQLSITPNNLRCKTTLHGLTTLPYRQLNRLVTLILIHPYFPK